MAGSLVFERITAGAHHTCGLTATGEAYCWGNNVGAQAEVGSTRPPFRTVPTRTAAALRFQRLEAGSAQTCGITTSGSGYCWGVTDGNRLGVGIGGADFVQEPLQLPIPEVLTSISVFYSHGCAIGTSGKNYCWGVKNEGELGTPFTNLLLGFEPYPIETAYGLPLSQIQTGAFGTCALGVDGSLYCWGWANSDGGAIVVVP